MSSEHLFFTTTINNCRVRQLLLLLLLLLMIFSFFFFFHLTYSRWTSSLPSCLWSQRIFPSLPGSRKFSTLTTRQPMVEFYLLTFPRFPLRKKEHKSYFGKNRTHDFRTSRCTAYLLDHSGDERGLKKIQATSAVEGLGFGELLLYCILQHTIDIISVFIGVNQVWLPILLVMSWILLVISWTGETIFTCSRSRLKNLVSRDRFGLPVQPLHTWNQSDAFPRWFWSLLSTAIDDGAPSYQVTQLRTDGVHCQEFAGTGQ